jgi:hypothetical protein
MSDHTNETPLAVGRHVLGEVTMGELILIGIIAGIALAWSPFALCYRFLRGR